MKVPTGLSRSGFPLLMTQAAALFLVLLVTVSSCLTLYIAMSAQSLPLWTTWVIDRILPFFRTIIGDVVSMTVATTPVILSVVCYKNKGGARVLNHVGIACTLVALVGVICGFAATAILGPSDPGLHGIGTTETILQLEQSAELSMRSSLVYLAVFFGFHENGQRTDKHAQT